MEQREQIDQVLGLLTEIQSEIRALRRIEDELWTLDDFANYYKVSRTTSYSLRKAPGFPLPIGLLEHKPRWYAKDIKAFVAKNHVDIDAPQKKGRPRKII